MTVPAAFTAALASRKATGRFWVEIAGIPYAYGNFSAGSEWFSGRAVEQRFEGVRPWMVREDGSALVPSLEAQQVDHLEGRVDMGALRLAIQNRDDALLEYWPTYRTDGRLELYASLDHDDPLLVAQELPGGSALSGYPTGAQTLYLHRETLLASARSGAEFTISRRGAYRSPASDHRGRQGSSVPGEVLTRYPRSMVGRRVWLYVGLDAGSATDAVLAFSGVVRGLGWQNGCSELVLSCDDWQGAIQRPLFTDLADVFARAGEGEPFANLIYLGADTYEVWLGGATSTLEVGESVYLPLLGTLALLTRLTPSTSTLGLGQYRFSVEGYGYRREEPGGTTAWPLSPAAALVAGQEPAGFYGGTGFTAGTPSGHPLSILLSILTSTGTGENGDYDVLPATRGCAIPAEEIDVAGIEALIARTPDLRVAVPVTEVVPNAREWLIAELLRPFGFYLAPVLGSSLSVRQLQAPSPDEIAAAPTLTTDDLARTEDGGLVRLEGPFVEMDKVVGGLALSDSPALVDGKLEPLAPVTITATESLETLLDYPNAQIVEITSHGLHGGRGQDGFAPRVDREAVLSRLLAAYAARYSRPPVSLKAAFDLRQIGLNVGDLVSLDFARVPSIRAAAFGTDGSYAEVTQKEVDLGAGLVTLTLTQSALGTARARYIAPACEITAWNAGTLTLTVAANAYTEAGVASDTDAFAVGYRVRIYREDLATRFAAVAVASKTATTLVLGAAPAGYTYAAGDVVLLADYASDGQVAAALGRYAYCASGSTSLLGTSDDPHVYV